MFTVADAVRGECTATAYCTNRGCESVRLDGSLPYGTALDLIKLDQAQETADLERRLTCRHCGAPGKLVIKRRPFITGAGSGFGTAGQWPRDPPATIPSPPERPDDTTPEVKWHNPKRRRRVFK